MELEDVPRSNRGARKGVQVRSLSAAPINERTDMSIGRVQLKLVSNAYLER